MDLITADLETHWATDYSLSKMSPLEYVMDERFEAISLAIKVNHYPTDVVFGEDDIRHALRSIKGTLASGMLTAHNMGGFDAYVFAYRFGITPKLWGCTLAMARPIHAKTCGLSLAALVRHYAGDLRRMGISTVKDNTALINTKGKRLADFTHAEIEAMRAYNRDDTEQCYGLFKLLKRHYTPAEMWHIDSTIRMRTEPAFELDAPLLRTTAAEEKERKHKALLDLSAKLNLDVFASDDEAVENVRAELASAPRFAALLESLDVEVPTKPSPTDPEKSIPALAKTDQAFLDLQEHDNDLVAAAARARLDVKSTLLETRIDKFLTAGSLADGMLPIPLRYCGADTTGRDSGEEYNPQNLSRVDPDAPRPSDALRMSLCAPKGKLVIVADQSGIELRINHFLWKVEESMALYEASPDKADLYRAFASDLYKKRPADISKSERHLGKMCIAEGTLVLTRRGEVPIEQVTASDRVWDGVEWVGTDGALYKGVKDVIQYDGLTATPDHEVWVEDGRKIPLGAASAQLHRLARTGAGGAPLGFGGIVESGGSAGQRVQVRTGSLHALPGGETDQLHQPQEGRDARVPDLQPEMRGPDVAPPEVGSGAAEVHEPERPGLPPVWRARCAVSLPNSGASRSVGHGESGFGAGERAGQEGQPGALRARQPSLGDPPPEHSEPGPQQVGGVPYISRPTPGGEVCRQHAPQPDRKGHDGGADSGEVVEAVEQTKRRVWDLLNCGPRHRFTANGRLVSNCQLGLGFGSGAATFQRIARVMGGIDIPMFGEPGEISSDHVVRTWRTKYADIVVGWKTCGAALQAIYDGKEREVDPWGLIHTCKEGFVLPSGRLIRYPDLRQMEDGTWPDGRAKTSWVYAHGRHMARITGPKVDENCLAGDSLILTEGGWKKLASIEHTDRVHDGVEFVHHSGLTAKGVQACISIDGVWMTPDHEVLTDEGWQAAGTCPRPFWPNIRLPDCDSFHGHRWAPRAVDFPVPVRGDGNQTRRQSDGGSTARRHPQLRMLNWCFDGGKTANPRHDRAPSVRSVARNAGSLPATLAQGMEKLWRAGHRRVRAMAGFVRGLLAGHGAVILAGYGSGSPGQRCGVFTGELSVGYAQGQHDEQAQHHPSSGHPSTEHGDRHQPIYTLLPRQKWVAAGQADAAAGCEKQVFDILNCGPRHRFVVLGDSGPFIVHNCVQALARDSVFDCSLEFFKRTGLRPALRVHDELVYVVDEGPAQDLLNELQAVMRTPPKWWPELVVWSEGDAAPRYGLAK